MFTVNTTRTHTIEYDNGLEGEENQNFSVTFSFPFTEDIDASEIRKRLGGINGEENDEDTKAKSSAYMFWVFRSSVVDQKGIVDQNGDEIKIKDSEGNIIEFNQKVVFEVVRSLPDMLSKVMTAYLGEKEKN